MIMKDQSCHSDCFLDEKKIEMLKDKVNVIYTCTYYYYTCTYEISLSLVLIL